MSMLFSRPGLWTGRCWWAGPTERSPIRGRGRVDHGGEDLDEAVVRTDLELDRGAELRWHNIGGIDEVAGAVSGP
jgi:hypothetical protein